MTDQKSCGPKRKPQALSIRTKSSHSAKRRHVGRKHKSPGWRDYILGLQSQGHGCHECMILIFLFQVHARIVVILVQCYLKGSIIRFTVSQQGKWMETKQEDSYLDGMAWWHTAKAHNVCGTTQCTNPFGPQVMATGRDFTQPRTRSLAKFYLQRITLLVFVS